MPAGDELRWFVTWRLRGGSGMPAPRPSPHAAREAAGCSARPSHRVGAGCSARPSPCTPLFVAYVQYNCFPTGPISSPPRAYVPRTPCASGWRPAATGAGGSVVQAADLSAFANHVSVDDQSTPPRRYPRKLRRRAYNATTWHAPPAPTIVLKLHYTVLAFPTAPFPWAPHRCY